MRPMGPSVRSGTPQTPENLVTQASRNTGTPLPIRMDERVKHVRTTRQVLAGLLRHVCHHSLELGSASRPQLPADPVLVALQAAIVRGGPGHLVGVQDPEHRRLHINLQQEPMPWGRAVHRHKYGFVEVQLAV